MSQLQRSFIPLAPSSQRPAPHATHSPSHCVRISTTTELPRVIDPLLAAMVQQGYGDSDRFAMRLALEEAVVNAVRHGHGGDTSLSVRIQYQVTPEQAVATVEDQGAGFDPSAVADPLAPENLERPCGRGLLLMRHYLSWVGHNERGNAVTLCRRRSSA